MAQGKKARPTGRATIRHHVCPRCGDAMRGLGEEPGRDGARRMIRAWECGLVIVWDDFDRGMPKVVEPCTRKVYRHAEVLTAALLEYLTKSTPSLFRERYEADREVFSQQIERVAEVVGEDLSAMAKDGRGLTAAHPPT